MTNAKRRPSERWTSYDTWNYGGMKDRLEKFMSIIDRSALLEHVQRISKRTATMSDAFSAGQFWCCFEFMLGDGNLIIARVRLPRHPDTNESVNEASELYAIECEVATMKFLQEGIDSVVSTPRLYAYEPPGSQQAGLVGACYMLMQGFFGNSLQDVKFDICDLPVSTQECIMAQWTSFQAEIARFCSSSIGSISKFSKESGPVIGPLAAAVAENFADAGPFHNSVDYFKAVGEARYREACSTAEEDGADPFVVLGSFIFRDIVENTDIYKGPHSNGPFHFNHMDLGTQNILVDDEFNFVGIIDWEFAQTAPFEVNHYPMPFPLISSDAETDEILRDPEHVAHKNVASQSLARDMYKRGFLVAEKALAEKGRALQHSIAGILNGPGSRIFAALEKIAVFDGMAEELTYEMVRLGLGFQGADARNYIESMRIKMERG